MRATNSKHQCGLPILPESPRVSRFVAQTVASPEKLCRLTVARRRRLFTVFPCAEFRVIVNGAANLAHVACRRKKATAFHFQRMSRRSKPSNSSPAKKLGIAAQNNPRPPVPPYLQFQRSLENLLQ